MTFLEGSREQDSDQPNPVLTSREEKELRGLHRRRYRERHGRFLVEGVRAVEDLLASDLTPLWGVVASSLGDTERGRSLVERITRSTIQSRVVSDAELARVAATESPQGVVMVASVPSWAPADLVRGPDPAVLLVLDAVQDPGNFGALVRSAEALGARGVVSLTGSVDPWNPKAVRAAMGSSFRLPIVELDWVAAAAWLRAQGFRILAGAVGGETVPRGASRTALVVGNEGAGVSEAVLSDADATVGVPLRGRAESLNVTAAAAILLYELTR